ncbi:unnamed protein product [Rotaria sp. Silwood2]|nr:unnamed protein product [Rotaria sp. Silwood2]
MEQIVKISTDEPVYLVQKVDHIDESTSQTALVTDEHDFWSSLSYSNNKRRQTNISILHDASFFCKKKISRLYFNTQCLPNQSLLKLGGRKVLCQFVPSLRRAHGPGAIFPLTSAQRHLFSVDYHHEGGARHWYIIPSCEKITLQTIIHKQNSSICPDHGQILIDPSVLDKYHVRYHRIIQHPNEFVILSAGTLTQSFTEDAGWSESIEFALPSWIKDGHANVSVSPCQCGIPVDSLSTTTDVTLFTHKLIQRYITSHLNVITNDNKSVPLKGSQLYP